MGSKNVAGSGTVHTCWSQSMAPAVTTWRLQLIVIGSMLSLVSQVTFIASQPKMPDRAMSALRKAQDLEAEGQSDVGRLEEIVEALRQESLEACLSASENDPEALERCRVLSYELNSAEQLLFKRRHDFRYIESDSY
ncbi:unnamed protein product [Symbiodinium microadriaticum]|nr:unnamed protein product [Symbiodinium microadriaticum]